MIMFNIGLYVFNWNYCFLMNSKEELSHKLKQKVDELEAELAIEEMLEMELTQKAHYDGMTKFLNRTAGSRILSRLFNDAIKNKQPLSVCYMDLNDLKKINDQWGHDFGDGYILNFVEVLRHTIRNDDMCVRMGGDEFLLILNNVSYDTAQIIWDKIENNLESFQLTNELSYKISVSHGIAEMTRSSVETYEDLINLADQKMFEEKRASKGEFYG